MDYYSIIFLLLVSLLVRPQQLCEQNERQRNCRGSDGRCARRGPIESSECGQVACGAGDGRVGVRIEPHAVRLPRLRDGIPVAADGHQAVRGCHHNQDGLLEVLDLVRGLGTVIIYLGNAVRCALGAGTSTVLRSPEARFSVHTTNVRTCVRVQSKAARCAH